MAFKGANDKYGINFNCEKYYIQFNTKKKKVIEVDSEDHIGELKAKTRLLFQIEGDFNLEIFVTDIQDWAELDNVSIKCKSNKMKQLKVVIPSESAKEVDTTDRWPRTPKAFFDQTLLCKLNEGKHLTKSEEQAICFYLYEDAKRFGKAYPSPTEYRLMVSQLFKSYPYLEVNMQDSMVYWKQKMKYFFQNSRKRSKKETKTVN